MEFIHEKNRIYATGDTGKLLAEVTFPLNAQGAYNINRTFVDPSLRGQGVAGQLLQAAAADIEKAGGRAAPTCSYAMDWFQKHPEYAGLLK